MKTKILIADDDRAVCQSLKLLFLTQGFEVQYIINPLNIVEFIASFEPDVLILDMNFTIETSGVEGLEIIQKVKRNYSDLPVILITAWGTLDLAVSGMKLGAIDFITKPWDNDSVVSAVKTQLHLMEKKEKQISTTLDKIIGKSEAILKVKSLVEKVAQTDAPVLILGESGTGKDFIAEIIHDLSDRKALPFTKLDVKEFEHFDRVLLGYRKNAFPEAKTESKGEIYKTGGGSLYLAHVSELSTSFQAKLLTILTQRKYSRIGAELEEDLRARILSSSRNTENLREDLVYKLGLVQIKIPSLSEIREDIPLLASHFLENLSKNKKKRKLDERALEWLATQDYVDNIRELKSWIERTYLLSEQNILTIKELKNYTSIKEVKTRKSTTLEDVEKQMIEEAIFSKKGNMTAVAQKLGMTRSTLYRRMNKFGITNPSENED